MNMVMEYGSAWSVETQHNIHMDTNMDMDKECIISHMETLHGVSIHTECQSTGSVETLHTLYPCLHIITDTEMDMTPCSHIIAQSGYGSMSAYYCSHGYGYNSMSAYLSL